MSVRIDKSENNPLPYIKYYDSSSKTWGLATEMYVPHTYSETLEDISESSAGRTENGTLYKKTIAKGVNVRSISLGWKNIPLDVAAYILEAFTKSEYFMPKFFDMATNKFIDDKEFYCGNRTVGMYNFNKGICESLSFNIIQRIGDGY